VSTSLLLLQRSANGVPAMTTTAVAPFLTTATSSRKTVLRAKQRLLADEDFFLKANLMTLFEGDPNTLPQGCGLECPNKNANNGPHRIDWQRNPTTNPDSLQGWFSSTKGFCIVLDAATQKWLDEATEGH